MKTIGMVAGAVIIISLIFIAPHLSDKLVPEAQALRGRGAAFVVGAAVGSAHSAPAPAPAPTTVIVTPPPAAPAPPQAPPPQPPAK
jgi:hypothetical protein